MRRCNDDTTIQRARESRVIRQLLESAKDERRSLTQAKIAEKIGKSQALLNAWSTGRVRVSDRSLFALCNVLAENPESVRPGVLEAHNVPGQLTATEREILRVYRLDPSAAKALDALLEYRHHMEQQVLAAQGNDVR